MATILVKCATTTTTDATKLCDSEKKVSSEYMRIYIHTTFIQARGRFIYIYGKNPHTFTDLRNKASPPPRPFSPFCMYINWTGGNFTYYTMRLNLYIAKTHVKLRWEIGCLHFLGNKKKFEVKQHLNGSVLWRVTTNPKPITIFNG